MAQIAQKASGSAPQEKEVALEEQHVSGGEEELVFAKATPTVHIRNLIERGRKENTQRDTVTSLGDRDTANMGRIGKKTRPNWDSDTGLGRDMNPVWENTEYSANSGKTDGRATGGTSERKIRQHSDKCTP